MLKSGPCPHGCLPGASLLRRFVDHEEDSTLGADHIPGARGSPEGLQCFYTESVTTSFSGSMRLSTHPVKCHCSMVRCPIFHKVTSGLTVNLDNISLNTGKSMIVWYMIFPVVMYGCESWSIKKAEHQRIDAFELWCWKRLLRVPWTAGGSTQLILKEINP